MFASAAISLVGFIACNRQENLKPDGLQMNENQFSNGGGGILCEPSNPNNPFDSVGRIHNEAILHIMAKDSISTPQITHTAIINYFKKNYAYHNTPQVL